MVHNLSPTGGLNPLGVKRRAPWKRIVTAIVVVGLFGLGVWWWTSRESDVDRTTTLDRPGDSAKLDTTKPITEVNVRLQWNSGVDLDLIAWYVTKSGDVGLLDYRAKEAPNIRLDTDAGVGDVGGRNEENIVISSLDDYKEIWFLASIFSKGGSYSDYDARVSIKTSNGDDIQVPLQSSDQKKYLVMAKLTNGPDGPDITKEDRPATCQEVTPILGPQWECVPLEPKIGPR